MNSSLLKRLFKAIEMKDQESLSNLAKTIIDNEKRVGHSKLASDLEKIMIPKSIEDIIQKKINKEIFSKNGLTLLPKNSRDKEELTTLISRNELRHHMVLSVDVEKKLFSIEKEFLARKRLQNHNLEPRKKFLLYGPPGCGKTMSAERLAWNVGLPLVKVRFDSIISSYFGETSSNLRKVFDLAVDYPCVLLLDECDIIAKTRLNSMDIGETSRIVNMLLLLLDEYNGEGILLATTNLEEALDPAIYRRFDSIIEMPKPGLNEISKLLQITLSNIPTSKSINWKKIANTLTKHSYSNIVKIATTSAKNSILDNNELLSQRYIESAIEEFKLFD